MLIAKMYFFIMCVGLCAVDYLRLRLGGFVVLLPDDRELPLLLFMVPLLGELDRVFVRGAVRAGCLGAGLVLIVPLLVDLFVRMVSLCLRGLLSTGAVLGSSRT